MNTERQPTPKPTTPDHKPRSPKQFRVPKEAQVLDALGKMPGAVAMGILTTAQANALRGVYHEILAALQRRGGQQEQKVATHQILDAIRQNPALLSLLEPFLTDEQFELARKMRTEADHGDA